MSKEKLLASAQKNLQKGQIGKAIKDYQKIVEADPRDVRNRQKLAELLSRDRMTDEALKEYAAVARHYADSGFYLKAIAVFKQMQRLDPARPEFYLSLAELNEKQGLVGNALAEYRSLAAFYEKNRMFSEELKILRKMRDLEPENLNIRIKIVEFSVINEEKEARQELQEVLDLLAAQKDSGRALRLYGHFLPKFPGDLLLLTGQAEALIETGEAERGAQLLQEILRQDADHEKALRLLAQVYRSKGKHQDALHIYQRLLSRQPEDLDLRESQIAAAIEAGEAGMASCQLKAWQEAFVAAGRDDVVRDFQNRLQNSGVAAPNPPQALTPRMPDAVVAIPADPEPDEIIEELEEIAELIEEADAETDLAASEETELELEELVLDPEEVSLDFLEEAPLEFPEENDTAAESVPETPAEVELELELDMGIEIESDLDLQIGLPAEVTLADPAEGETPVAAVERGPHIPEITDPAPEAEIVSGAGDFFELGAGDFDLDDIDIENALDEAGREEIAAAETAAPKRRIKTGVEVEDPESHYNLGIAYKEMGLLDDAIGEFDKAMRAPERTVPSLILKGICLMEKGEGKKAEEIFKAGLSNADIDESGRVGLQYELGVLYESSEQLLEALESFQFVIDRDLFYRDAGERAAELRRRLGLESSSGEGGAGGGKNRVSYV